MLADIVIIPLVFLQCKGYLEYCDNVAQFQPGVGGLDDRIVELKGRGRNNFGYFDFIITFSDEAGIILQRTFWHRVICDEFHELVSNSVAKKQEAAKSFFLDNLHGRIFLGLTGTPHYNDSESGISSGRPNILSPDHGDVFEHPAGPSYLVLSRVYGQHGPKKCWSHSILTNHKGS